MENKNRENIDFKGKRERKERKEERTINSRLNLRERSNERRGELVDIVNINTRVSRIGA